jgi:hypothetical protein
MHVDAYTPDSDSVSCNCAALDVPDFPKVHGRSLPQQHAERACQNGVYASS